MSACRAVHTILFVRDVAASRRFYSRVLGVEPRLDVPGMVEIELQPSMILGLMPAGGITRLLDGAIDPTTITAAGRAELYLLVDDPSEAHARALREGAQELSPLTDRDWGHRAAYSLDLDGYVLAFAAPLS